MKKLSIISDQIKNQTFSYTGKGAFEAIVNQNKEQIESWLEDLIPIQIQIERLNQMFNIEFQKRNYTRILTKLLPEKYTEFVSLNILVRDSNEIANYYNNEYNITILYDKLIQNKLLKYPGKYDKYVDFNIFQKFIMMYREDLIASLNNTNNISAQVIQRSETNDIEQDNTKNIEHSTNEQITQNDTQEDIPPPKDKKDTNWTNLLLGKIK